MFTGVFQLHALAQPQAWEDREPEAATGVYQKDAVTANEYMVSAANPHASKAGLRILERGGSAIDAAIAVQAMLSLVEPQSSGIGGGAFIPLLQGAAADLYNVQFAFIVPLVCYLYIGFYGFTGYKYKLNKA